MAKIDRDTPDPIGGKIDKDQNGNPNGVLIDKAFVGRINNPKANKRR